MFKHASVRIYFAADIHKTQLEIETLKSAEIILTTSFRIREHIKNLGYTATNLGHGVADYFFRDFTVISKNDGAKKVGYVGNLLRDWIDFDAIEEMILQNEDIEFHFLGPVSNSNLGYSAKSTNRLKRLSYLENVFFLGQVTPQDIPTFLAKMDVLFMCYSKQYQEQAANPHKVLEYLSSGKPIVSSYLDEYSDQSDLIQMVEENSNLSSVLKKAIDGPKNNKIAESRINFAKSRTYKEKVRTIEKVINEWLSSQ